ncbi:plasminogen-like [Asterias amurensis]|uniref:plasminogen-like n=1 Tax=Asterias amurensis TaxID=7602 RepID=UPI003AB19D1E
MTFSPGVTRLILPLNGSIVSSGSVKTKVFFLNSASFFQLPLCTYCTALLFYEATTRGTTTIVTTTAPLLDCYDPNGQDYRGTVSQTATGIPCQNWIAQSPHKHPYSPQKNADQGIGYHNYCRIPDDDIQPWCYTIDPAIEREHCFVRKCQNQEATTRGTTTIVTTTAPPLECYDPNGQDYSGTVSQTATGIPCQNWASQSPHRHRYSPDKYAHRGIGHHNYCRNPDGDIQPWCYTHDPARRWEYCIVRKCQNQGGPELGEPQNVL